MSLRLRLTLVYTVLLGSVLLLFGGMVYGLVSVFLYNKIDDTLTKSADDLVELIRLNENGQFDTRAIAAYQSTENLLIQIWGVDRRIRFARPAGAGGSLDSVTRAKGITAFSTVTMGGQHLRVYTIPLSTARGPAGTLQLATTLTIVDVTQNTLSTILIVLISMGMILSAVLVWMLTRQVLQPLATMTSLATQITRADDLSRRIPIAANKSDEVGRLVKAFNQTLARLEVLFHAQQRFLGDVSHELRTPLTVIKGNVGLVRKIGPDEESLGSIETEVDRLSRLVGDLLLINQADAGMMPLDFVKVDIDDVLMDVFKQMNVIAGEKVKIQVDELAPIQVEGDRDRLKQVFLNLVANAVQYTPSGGEVHLGMEVQDECVNVFVQDNGPGIDEKDLPHLFDRFYRGDKARTRNAGGGFGLGLSIAQWIVLKHGGSITVKTQKGRGTTFTVAVPISK